MQTEIEKNTLLILLSGPEPQRSQFEKIIFSQLGELGMKCTVVRGMPGSAPVSNEYWEGIKIVNHLPSEELNLLLCKSEIIITRSGYSSIMDLIRIQRNAVLVPTPGQTEQEYLGLHMQEMNWMLTVQQKNFNLKKAIESFKAAKLTLPQIPESSLEKTVEELLNKLC